MYGSLGAVVYRVLNERQLVIFPDKTGGNMKTVQLDDRQLRHLTLAECLAWRLKGGSLTSACAV